MNKTLNNKLYNYLVNQFGISKEVVMDYIKERLEDLISKQVEAKLMESNYVHDLILNRVTHIVTQGMPTGRFPFLEKECFDSYLKKIIREIVEERLGDDYSLEFKMSVKK